jgi:hypothetical protein
MGLTPQQQAEMIPGHQTVFICRTVPKAKPLGAGPDNETYRGLLEHRQVCFLIQEYEETASINVS